MKSYLQFSGKAHTYHRHISQPARLEGHLPNICIVQLYTYNLVSKL